jgi:hypothetical protein
LQPPLPSHLPFLPQGLLGEVSSLHVSESVASLATLAHAPLLLHFWQVPQALTEQQAPSTQLPDVHCPPEVQAAPSGFRPQLPPLQVPELQSPSPLQVCRHTPAAESHLKLPHDWVCMAGQAPAPSHLASSTAVLVLEGQLFSRQVVLVPHLLQLPPASHLPSLPQLVGALATHIPAGSTVPAATFLHVPTDPVTLQLLHWPLQALSQQMLSTQKPEAHSVLPEHDPPLLVLPQLVPVHTLGGKQLLLPEHESKQAVPLLLHT